MVAVEVADVAARLLSVVALGATEVVEKMVKTEREVRVLMERMKKLK
jgi:hypothetical protein